MSSNKLHLPLLAALFALVMPGRADDCWIFTLKEGQTKNGTVTCGPWTFDAYTTGTTAANGVAGLKVGGQQTEVYDASKETLAEPTLDFSLPVRDADGTPYAFTAYGDVHGRFRFTTVNKTNIKHVVWSPYATVIPGPFQTLGDGPFPTLKTITCHSDVLEQVNSIAFERCSSLVHFDVRAPKLKRVMDGAFSGSALTNNIHDILASNAENAQGFRNSKVCGDALPIYGLRIRNRNSLAAQQKSQTIHYKTISIISKKGNLLWWPHMGLRLFISLSFMKIYCW